VAIGASSALRRRAEAKAAPQFQAAYPPLPIARPLLATKTKNRVEAKVGWVPPKRALHAATSSLAAVGPAPRCKGMSLPCVAFSSWGVWRFRVIAAAYDRRIWDLAAMQRTLGKICDTRISDWYCPKRLGLRRWKRLRDALAQSLSSTALGSDSPATQASRHWATDDNSWAVQWLRARASLSPTPCYQ
jgi:hypothetical protein